VHVQDVAAVAGLLPAIATDAATAATTNVKGSNRICRLPFCLAVARSDIMPPQHVRAKWEIALYGKYYRATIEKLRFDGFTLIS
jgi:hypothetical protein